jgi:hypothetical protein
MRAINMQGMMVVHCGEEWQHEEPPCSRAMVKFLERNEDVVTWVQVPARSLVMMSMALHMTVRAAGDRCR